MWSPDPYCCCRRRHPPPAVAERALPFGVCAQAFVKTVNYNHLMPTRYTLDLDLKARGNSTPAAVLCIRSKRYIVTGLRDRIPVFVQNVTSAEALENATKTVAALKEAKKLLEERFKSGKNRCALSLNR